MEFGLVLFTIVVLFFVLFYDWGAKNQDCIKRDFGYGSFVCVCNATYCDRLSSVTAPQKGTLVRITSNQDDKRWFKENYYFDFIEEEEFDKIHDVIIKINRSQTFQKILGFGGSFTDSTGINLQSIPVQLKDFVMRGYFSKEGLEYNLGRIPIAGTDFSPRGYSYDDLPEGQVDPSLEHFSLAEEDFQYKIPYIKQALSLGYHRGIEIKLYASPWSAPGWMKTTGSLVTGQLLKEYYSVWAKYFIRFFEEYQNHGIIFYGFTTQGSPQSAAYNPLNFNQMSWNPEEHGRWIVEHLGPQLHESQFKNISMLILDDQRTFLLRWATKVLENKDALKYIDGVGIHWYMDSASDPKDLITFHNMFPNLTILYTEACEGWFVLPWQDTVHLGSWERAENYAKDIIETLQHWVVGWTDWNMVLNLKGGPSWVENLVDSPVIVNEEEKEIYRQPMYYALAHFSKVLPEGSVRIGHSLQESKEHNLDVVIFQRPDGAAAAVIANTEDFPVYLELQDEGESVTMEIEQRSIVSLIWNV